MVLIIIKKQKKIKMSNPIEKCMNCNKPFPKEEEYKVKFKQYLLWKGKQADRACEDCWNQKQSDFKQKYKEVWKRNMILDIVGESPTGNSNYTDEVIWDACELEDCQKLFEPGSIEGLRHIDKNVRGGNIDSELHEELNKNPNPVNSEEELVKQWMISMNYRKVYRDNNKVGIIKSDGSATTIKIEKGVKWCFAYRVNEWLKTQPNQAYERSNTPTKNPDTPNNDNNNPNNPPINTGGLNLNQLQNYFQINHIEVIKKQPNNDLLVSFEDNNTAEQTINESDNTMDEEQRTILKQLRELLEENNLTSLSRQQLDQILAKQNQQSNNTPGSNYTPWIIGGIAVVALLVIVGVVIVSPGKKEKKDGKK